MLDLSLKELDKVKKLEEKRSYINKKEKIKNEPIDIIKEPEIVEPKLDKSQPKIVIINTKKKTSVNNFYLGKKKIRIAVLDFKYKSSSYYKNDITQSFTEYITSKLINSNIKIAERSQIDEVIKELKFENSEYVLSSTAKKIGNIYGIDYLLLGYVLDFSSETKSAYQKKQTIYKKIYFSRISFKLVNISTGELEVSDVISDSYQDSNNYYESTSNSEIEEYLISSISKKINNIIIEKLNSKFYKSKK